MNIRLYQNSDEKVIRDMMLALNSEDAEEIPLNTEKLETFFTRLNTNNDLKVFLAEESGKPFGYATLSFSFSTEFGGRYVEIEELYIQPEFRGKGHGKEFISSLEQLAKQDGAKSVFLVVSTNNKLAQKLYSDLGYKQLPRVEYIKFI